jgi:beta-lactamase regulating signal transducer with metallopeptidase domain
VSESFQNVLVFFESLKFFDNTRWFSLFLEITLKGSVILGFTFLLVMILRRASASTRHMLLSLAVLCIIILPFLTIFLPGWEIEVFSPEIQQKISLISNIYESKDFTIIQDKPDLNESGTAVTGSVPEKSFNWITLIQLIWTGGMLLVLTRFLTGIIITISIRKKALPVEKGNIFDSARSCAQDIGLKRNFRLFLSSRTKVPLTFGWVSPVVILPEGLLDQSAGSIKIVLLHELAHIKRYDVLITVITHAASIIYWFNPLVWFSLKRLYIDRESASDDYVLGAGIKASEYAGYLLDMAKSVNTLNWTAPIGVTMALKYKLEERIMNILINKKRRNKTRLPLVIISLLLLSAFTFPLAGMELMGKKAEIAVKTQSEEDRVKEVVREFFNAVNNNDLEKAKLFLSEDFLANNKISPKSGFFFIKLSESKSKDIHPVIGNKKLEYFALFQIQKFDIIAKECDIERSNGSYKVKQLMDIHYGGVGDKKDKSIENAECLLTLKKEGNDWKITDGIEFKRLDFDVDVDVDNDEDVDNDVYVDLDRDKQRYKISMKDSEKPFIGIGLQKDRHILIYFLDKKKK